MTDKPARGSIGNEIFDEVERLVAGEALRNVVDC